jgi:hypothetical protein
MRIAVPLTTVNRLPTWSRVNLSEPQTRPNISFADPPVSIQPHASLLQIAVTTKMQSLAGRMVHSAATFNHAL